MALDATTTATPTVLIVTGSGRSGTSSLAGSLHRLGLHVPEPHVEPKPTNPRGFYEPRWVIDFHKKHLRRISLHNIDSRPDAPRLLAELTADGAIAEELHGWLADRLDHPQIAIKDPHAYWFAEVWHSVTADLGADLRFLTSLRHPAEVVGSRDLAYLQEQPERLRRIKETSNVAGWVQSVLLTELAGRDSPRAFVRYIDVISDWRVALERARGQLDLTFNADLTTREPHPVDDFVDAGMRRSELTWDDITVPARLRDMAEEVWQLVNGLVEDPYRAESLDRLREIRGDYVAMYDEAIAMTYDHTRAVTVLAVREESAKLRSRNRKLRRRLEKQRALTREALAESRQPSPTRGSVARGLRRVAARARRR